MPIQYVGGVVGGRTGSTSTTTQSLSGTLTGGIDTSPKPHDLVIVTCVVGSQARNPAQAITGYTALTQLNPNAQTYDTSLCVSYKRMVNPADTSITIPASGNTADAQTWVVQVFRGVNYDTPLDVTPVSASGTGTTRANPAAITPVTAGAWVVACCGGAANTASALTFAGLTNVRGNNIAGTNDSVVACGYTTWTSGALDVAVSSTGDATATSSWAAYAIALRPNPDMSALTDDFDDGVLDTGKWATETPAGSSATESGGVINLEAADSSFVNLWGSVYRCLTGSAVAVRFVSPPQGISGAAAGYEAGLRLVDDVGNAFDFLWISDGTSTGALRTRYNGIQFGTTVAYSPSTHAWLRFRESAGTLYADVAPATASNPPVSGDWVNFASVTVATLGFPLSNIAVSLRVVRGASLPSPTGPAKFDGFNAAASVTSLIGSLSGTESGADTASAAGVVSIAGAISTNEVGSDTAAATGVVKIVGPLAVTEAGNDTFAAAALLLVNGSLTVNESGVDTFAAVAGRPGLSTVTESFAGALDLDKWEKFENNGTVSIVDGVLDLTTGNTVGSTAAIRTLGAFALAESEVYIQVVRPLAGSISADGALMTMRIHDTATDGDWVEWFINSVGTLVARIGDDYGTYGDNTALEWDPVNHKWLRIRMSGGTVYWDTAPDSGSGTPGAWTTRRTASTLPSDFTSTKLILWLAYQSDNGAGTIVQSAQFDGLNTTGTAPPLTGALTATESGADAAVAIGSVSVAGTLAASEAGADALAGAATVSIAGALGVSESGIDTISSLGVVTVQGTAVATEPGSDGFAVTGTLGNLLISTFAESFDAALDTANKWATGGTLAVTGGVLDLAPDQSGGATSWIQSKGTYSLEGSECYIQVVRPLLTGGSTESAFEFFEIGDAVGNGNAVQWVISSLGNLVARVSNAGTPVGDVTVGTWNSASHKWLKISMVGGTVTWSTAPDSGSGTPGAWTVQRTASTLPSTFTSVKVTMWAIWYGPDATTQTGQFDGLNTTGTAATIAGTLAAGEPVINDAFASSGTVIVAGPLIVSEAATDALSATGVVKVAGVLATSEPTTDTFAATGAISVSGSLGTAEAGADTGAGSGSVVVAGALAAAEQGADTLTSTGIAGVTGTLATTESNDVFGADGKVTVTGALAVGEVVTPDSAAFTGKVAIQGALAALEPQDVFAGIGHPEQDGDLIVTETGADMLSGAGAVLVYGALAAGESAQPDSFAALGRLYRIGALAAAETGADGAAATGVVAIAGGLNASESKDTLTAPGRVAIVGAFSASESGADTAAMPGGVMVRGALSVAEDAGLDTFETTGGKVFMTAAMNAIEAPDTFEAVGLVFTSGAMSATEPTSDSVVATGGVMVAGVMAITEANQDDQAAMAGGVHVTGALAVAEAAGDGMYAEGYLTGSSNRSGFFFGSPF